MIAEVGRRDGRIIKQHGRSYEYEYWWLGQRYTGWIDRLAFLESQRLYLGVGVQIRLEDAHTRLPQGWVIG